MFFLLILSLPLENFNLGDIGGLVQSATVPQLIMPVIILWFALRAFFQLSMNRSGSVLTFQQKKTIVLFCGLLTLFFCFEMVSSLKNPHALDLLSVFRMRLTSLFFFLIPILVLSQEDAWKSTLDCYLITVFAICLLAILVAMGKIHLDFGRFSEMQKSLGGTLFQFRTAGTLTAYGNVATLVSFSLTYIVHAVFLRQEKKKYKVVLMIGVLFLIAVASLAFQSRNVWLSSIISVASLLFLTFYRRLSLFKIFFTLVLFVVLIFSTTFLLQMLSSAYETAASIRQEAVDTRLEMFADGIELFIHKPLWGIGPGTFDYIYDYQMHNMYLVALLQGGIGGFALFYLYLLILIKLYRGYAENPLKRILLASFLGFLVAGSFYPAINFGSSIVWLMLGCFAAGCVSQNGLHEERSRQTVLSRMTGRVVSASSREAYNSR